MQKKQAETLESVLDQYLKVLGLDKKIKENEKRGRGRTRRIT